MFPRIGITAGDPAGIGPEIVVRALAEARLPASGVVVFAEPELFDGRCHEGGAGVLPRWTGEGSPGETPCLFPVTPERVPKDFAPGAPSAFGGRVAAAAVEAAVRAALEGKLDAPL